MLELVEKIVMYTDATGGDDQSPSGRLSIDGAPFLPRGGGMSWMTTRNCEKDSFCSKGQLVHLDAWRHKGNGTA